MIRWGKYKCGIYQIRNLMNNKIYVGSSINIRDRWNKYHFPRLRKNKHDNQYLQRSWNKYGEQNFVFEIVEIIFIKNKEYILEREQYWIDFFKSFKRDIGYNILEKAGSPIGSKHSKETKEKISKFFKGRRLSEEHKDKLRLSQKNRKDLSVLNERYRSERSGEKSTSAKLSWDEVRDIRNKYSFGNSSYEKLSKEYNVSRSCIQLIIENKRWKEEINV